MEGKKRRKSPTSNPPPHSLAKKMAAMEDGKESSQGLQVQAGLEKVTKMEQTALSGSDLGRSPSSTILGEGAVEREGSNELGEMKPEPEERLQQCWEAQWQHFLKDVEATESEGDGSQVLASLGHAKAFLSHLGHSSQHGGKTLAHFLPGLRGKAQKTNHDKAQTAEDKESSGDVEEEAEVPEICPEREEMETESRDASSLSGLMQAEQEKRTVTEERNRTGLPEAVKEGGRGLPDIPPESIRDFWERAVPDDLARQPRKGLQQRWESQLQEFLKALESPHGEEGSPQLQGPLPRNNIRPTLSPFKGTAKSSQQLKGERASHLLPSSSREGHHAERCPPAKGKLEGQKAKRLILGQEASSLHEECRLFRSKVVEGGMVEECLSSIPTSHLCCDHPLMGSSLLFQTIGPFEEEDLAEKAVLDTWRRPHFGEMKLEAEVDTDQFGTCSKETDGGSG
ncbi:hypothetical protein JD844_013707 [Phrynosoma platyrhinos]|uniref:Uncharacterized protein n=1 Tax=Phrynosoma platyrhinos TaxID=52577 RepID=A0ABQ7TMF1_PHRPL|nr:hypothetical protein JD844_013707 [Phrynosoma platyrhinos]